MIEYVAYSPELDQIFVTAATMEVIPGVYYPMCIMELRKDVIVVILDVL